MKTNLKSMKGITLIALVITIIILIILAGVSLNILLGTDGLIEKAKRGANTYNEEALKEKMELALVDYRIGNVSNNKTLVEFLEENEIKYGIEQISDNGDGTYSILLNGYTVIINNKLEVEQIEEETQFKKDTRGKARFVIVPETGYTSMVQASIEIDDSVNMYTIQYNVIDNNKTSSNWVTYEPGTTIDISDNKIIYGRIINSQTNEEGSYFRKEITNIDKEKPKKATISFDDTEVKVNQIKEVNVIQEDAKSGIDITKCKYIVNDSNTEIGIDSTTWDSAVAFTQENETINVTKSEAGTYYLHVLSVDILGNKIETVSKEIEVKGPIYYLNSSDFGNVNNMEGWDVVGSLRNDEINVKGTAYVVSKNKYNFDEINKLISNIPIGTTTSGVNGTITLGLVEEPDSSNFIVKNSISYTYSNQPPSIIEVDLSNIEGEYYIKIIFTASSYRLRTTGGGTIRGE